MRYSLLSSIFFMSCISLFIFLGLWQLDRADEKKNIVKLNQERESLTPIYIKEIPKKDIEYLDYRNLRLRGKYLEETFLLDNKINQKKVGLNIISLFQLSDTNQIVLIDRGWVQMQGERKDISKNYFYLVKDLPLNRQTEISGKFKHFKEKPFSIGDISTDKKWPRLIQNIDFIEIKKILNNDDIVEDVILRLGSNNLGVYKRNWKVINMSSDKHLGYAVQWFGLAFLLLFIYIFIILRKTKNAS